MKSLALSLGLVTGLLCLSSPAISAQTLYEQAVQAYNKRDYSTACSALELFLKKSPEDVNALYYDALCWYQLKNSEMAMQRYKRIIAIAPDTAAGKFAHTALSALQTSSKTSPVSQPVAGLNAVQSTAPTSKKKDEMDSLPDTANFYFTKQGSGHMAVSLLVNGHPVQALFDTGAGAFFYRDQLVAAGVDCNKAVPCGVTHGWAGKAVPVSSMPAEVKLGTMTRNITLVMESSASGLDNNLIGQDFIQGYQYEIDDKGGRVDLRKTIAKTDQKQDSMYDVPLNPKNGRDLITIEVNGRTTEAFIDTGSVYTIISGQEAERLGVETASTQRMIGVGGALSVGVGTARIRFGPISKDFTVRIGGAAGTCIGQDFMEGWRFKIDREHHLLRFFH